MRTNCTGLGALTACIVLMLSGCAVEPIKRVRIGSNEVAVFSDATMGQPLAPQWTPWKVRRDKRDTEYTLVVDQVPQDDGTVAPQTVLRARAVRSASGLKQEATVDLARYPTLRWEWKIEGLIADADNTRRDREDAPVRVILAFDGDRTKLSFRERLIAEQAKLISGHDLPYATLMYIWANRAPLDDVIPNAITSRIKMIVAQTGAEGVGRWQVLQRDIAADFVRAFGEPPGALLGVSVMTDSDNTGGVAQAWYGDIEFIPAGAR